MADKALICRLIAEKAAASRSLAKDIWTYAELPYEEFRSAARIIEMLRAEGFEIEEGLAGMPTAFRGIFRNGTGKPVMGLLAEYDALEGLGQEAGVAERRCPEGCGAGHGCGHNLLGAGCVAAAVALKDYMKETGMDGTVMLFGCPAEEGAGSKQFIARAGYFDDVDFAYTWHPDDKNEVSADRNVAIIGANFTFEGVSAHAGAAPEMGRSALDAAELTNIGCNYLREHMIDQARIHYAYTDAGGTAANVVPSHTSIKYEVRAPRVHQAQELFLRVVNVAKGAALMTDTSVEYEVTMAFSDYLVNRTLGAVVAEALAELGAPDWSEEDYQLAFDMLHSYKRSHLLPVKESLRELFPDQDPEELMRRPLHSGVLPFEPEKGACVSGSTDVGDVGYATPTVMFEMATACFGFVGHTWQNTAMAGSEIGLKGMLKAAEVMALAAVKTAERPDLIEKARKELLEKNGGSYSCPLPDHMEPPIGRY